MTTAIEPKNGKSVTLFGTRDDVRELTERLKLMLPGGEGLGANQIRALAQAAVAHGLDPFNGEIWYIPGRGLMMGIKGLRKKAREQVKGNFWIDFREVSADERARWGIPADALAFEARLFDSENVRQYTEIIERMLKAGIPWEAVKGMVGERPYTSGIGVLRKEEKTKMERAQCAMKRAEADAVKRRFDVPFGLTVEAEAEPFAGEWIEGEAHYTDDEGEKKSDSSDDLAAKRAAGSAALFGDDDVMTDAWRRSEEAVRAKQPA